jgi:hypothetical protein
MMKAVLVFAVMLAVANAHWTHDDSLAIEIGAPPGEKMPAGLVENSLSLVEEKAKSGSGPVVYRITVGTKQESADNAATNSPWSTHKFQINIEGVGGQKTGNMQIRYYAPSLSYGAASGGASSMAPAFHPGMVPTDCEPNTGDCGKFLAGGGETKYEGNRHGLIQHGQIESSEKVGELKTVTISEVTDGLKQDEYDGWNPSFIKINANNFKTGLGAGVYYIDPANMEVRGTKTLVATLPDKDGNVGEGKKLLKKCLAQFCEEEMDDKMGLGEESK